MPESDTNVDRASGRIGPVTGPDLVGRQSLVGRRSVAEWDGE